MTNLKHIRDVGVILPLDDLEFRGLYLVHNFLFCPENWHQAKFPEPQSTMIKM